MFHCQYVVLWLGYTESTHICFEALPPLLGAMTDKQLSVVSNERPGQACNTNINFKAFCLFLTYIKIFIRSVSSQQHYISMLNLVHVCSTVHLEG